MRSSVFQFLPIIAAVLVTTTVSACEGECITGVTNAFIQRYQDPIQIVLTKAANEIISKLPESGVSRPPIAITYPCLTAYREEGRSRMQQAIFPGYFHGKCEREDPDNPGGPLVNPRGCPNPDCPVVCGTPGSMVHFFPKLRYIAYNETKQSLELCSRPDSLMYKEVEKNVLQGMEESRQQERKRAWIARRGVGAMIRKADHDEVRRVLKEVLGKLVKLLEKQCGGTGTGVTNGLPDCSWEDELKAYILTFP